MFDGITTKVLHNVLCDIVLVIRITCCSRSGLVIKFIAFSAFCFRAVSGLASHIIGMGTGSKLDNKKLLSFGRMPLMNRSINDVPKRRKTDKSPSILRLTLMRLYPI